MVFLFSCFFWWAELLICLFPGASVVLKFHQQKLISLVSASSTCPVILRAFIWFLAQQNVPSLPWWSSALGLELAVSPRSLFLLEGSGVYKPKLLGWCVLENWAHWFDIGQSKMKALLFVFPIQHHRVCSLLLLLHACIWLLPQWVSWSLTLIYYMYV